MRNTKLFLGLLSVFFLMGAAAAARADDAPTRGDAVTLVKQAVAELKTAGNSTVMAEISDPKGKFIKGDLYLVSYDMTGKCLAHGSNQALVNKDLSNLKDVSGKPFVAERITLAKTQDNFWQDYKYMNPVTHQVADKTSYCEKAADILICGGVYK